MSRGCSTNTSVTNSLNMSVILCENIFNKPSFPNSKSLGAKVHLPPPVTCQVSHVMCQMSHVRCHMLLFIFFYQQSGVACQWRVCYQRGLPHLCFIVSRIRKEKLQTSGLLVSILAGISQCKLQKKYMIARDKNSGGQFSENVPQQVWMRV